MEHLHQARHFSIDLNHVSECRLTTASTSKTPAITSSTNSTIIFKWPDRVKFTIKTVHTITMLANRGVDN